MTDTPQTPQTAAPDTRPAPDPVTYTPPTITVEGRTYTLQRLGLQHALLAGRIVQAGLRRMAAHGNVTDGMTFAAIAMAALVDEEEAITRLLASAVGVTVKTFTDPEQFPIGSIFEIIEALGEHEDIRAFLAKSAVLAAKVQGAAGAWTNPTPTA